MYTDNIKNWRIAQKAGALLPCPRCGGHKMKQNIATNSLSRRADVYVCDNCGTQEALEDLSAMKLFPELQKDTPEYNTEFLKRWWLNTGVFNTPKQDRGDTLEIRINRSSYIFDIDLDDIVRSALEGALENWASHVEPEGRLCGDYLFEQITRGGELRIFNERDGNDYLITLDKFLAGFSLACKNNCGDWFDHSGNIDCCKIHYEDADIILQNALFGCVRYDIYEKRKSQKNS